MRPRRRAEDFRPKSRRDQYCPSCLRFESYGVSFSGMGIGSMIEYTAGVCGGRARLAGTRVPVHRVAGYFQLGYSPEEILALLNSLNLSQIYAALAHALANPDETAESLQQESAEAERHRAPTQPA